MKTSNQEPFSFIVDDVFQLSSGQLVITGQIKSGEIKNNENLKIAINNVANSATIEKMEFLQSQTSLVSALRIIILHLLFQDFLKVR